MIRSLSTSTWLPAPGSLRDALPPRAPCRRRAQRCGLDLAAWRGQCRGLARGVAETIARHHGAALQREIRDRLQGTTDTYTELVISTLEGRGRLEAAASELGQVDLGALERSGTEGAETAIVLRDMLTEQLAELEALYLIDAELAVMNEAGVRTYAALVGSAAHPTPRRRSRLRRRRARTGASTQRPTHCSRALRWGLTAEDCPA